MNLIVPRPEGLYCPPGDFYIDPWRPVARAVITHGHGDHARFGSDAYLCHDDSVPILRRRLGEITVRGAAYGETVELNGVKLSLASGRAYPRLGSGQGGASRRGLGRLGRLQDRAGRNLRPVRADPLPRLHHREHVRLADLPLAATS